MGGQHPGPWKGDSLFDRLKRIVAELGFNLDGIEAAIVVFDIRDGVTVSISVEFRNSLRRHETPGEALRARSKELLLDSPAAGSPSHGRVTARVRDGKITHWDIEETVKHTA